jgi:HPt (histidine-containing phosphotransfer) domain-containing protein
VKEDLVINIIQLKTLEDLTGEEDQNFAISLIEKFLTLLPKRVEALRKAMMLEDFCEVCREIHSFKTSCEIVGADLLKECLLRLELDARSNNVSSMPAHLNQLERDSERTKNKLNLIIKTSNDNRICKSI